MKSRWKGIKLMYSWNISRIQFAQWLLEIILAIKKKSYQRLDWKSSYWTEISKVCPDILGQDFDWTVKILINRSHQSYFPIMQFKYLCKCERSSFIECFRIGEHLIIMKCIYMNAVSTA